MYFLKKSILLALFITIAIPSAIIPKTSHNLQQQTKSPSLNIQIPVNIPELTLIQQKLSSIIKKIVNKELGLKPVYNTREFFRIQERPHISLYFVGEINTAHKGKDVIYDAIRTMLLKETTFTLNNIHLSSDVDFFGSKKNTLVVLVKDLDNELSLLNKKIQTALHQANEQYAREHNNTSLYNLKKGEEFSYNPHISLGWIAIDAIKERITNKKQTNAILKRIRQQILQEAKLLFNEFLNKKNSRIILDTLSIFDLESRSESWIDLMGYSKQI